MCDFLESSDVERGLSCTAQSMHPFVMLFTIYEEDFVKIFFYEKWKNFVGRTKIPAVIMLSYDAYDNNGYKLCAYKES